MMHSSVFEYLKPTDSQLETMARARAEFHNFAHTLDTLLPKGLDKDHVMRLLRDAAMWANVSITRHSDGTPRT